MHTVLFVYHILIICVLQNKYTGSMRDKAELSDRIEQLEYLVMQLEGESETIGK